MCECRLTKKAEPPPTRDVNRDSGTDSANGGWLRRLVRRHYHNQLFQNCHHFFCDEWVMTRGAFVVQGLTPFAFMCSAKICLSSACSSIVSGSESYLTTTGTSS